MIDSLLPATRHVAHWAPLLPLVACVVQLLRHRDPSNDALLLSAAFAVSFVANLIGKELFDAGRNTLWLTYVYAPIQYSLFAVVILPKREFRTFAVLAVLWLAALSAAHGVLAKPEIIVQVGCGVVLGWLMWTQPSPFRGALLTYCVGAAPFALAMGVIPLSQPRAWNAAWLGFQVTSVLALCLMTGALIYPPRVRLEVVTDGLGPAQDPARRWQVWRWRFDRTARRAHRAAAATPRKAG